MLSYTVRKRKQNTLPIRKTIQRQMRTLLPVWHMMGCRNGHLFHQIHQSLFLGDFNQSSLYSTLSNFQQDVTCPTRRMDLLYGTVKDAFKSLPLSPLPSSDHISGILLPANQTVPKSSRCKGQKLKPAVMDLCSAYRSTSNVQTGMSSKTPVKTWRNCLICSYILQRYAHSLSASENRSQ